MSLEGKQFSHYRVLKLVGRGGMGEVYLAEDVQILRQVAVKFIRIEDVQFEQGSAAETLRLFWREAMNIAMLDHPNILPLYDHGEITLDEIRVAYLIIPYRPEGALNDWLRRREQMGQLSVKQAVHIITQAGQALQYAHDYQMMHLDVKPANFLIRGRAAVDGLPDLQLSDFGIARLATTTNTASQHIRGTLTYMAPEQLDGQPVFASDQYALAIMAYELLAGKPPFTGMPAQVIYAHINKQPESVGKDHPWLPQTVDLVLARALAKRPEQRYPSIAAFVQAFQIACLGVDEKNTLLIRPPAPTPPPTLLSTPPTQTPAPFYAARTERAPNTSFPNRSSQPFTTVTTSPVQPDSRRPGRSRSRLIMVFSILLSLLLIGGGILSFYMVAKDKQPGPGNSTHITPTAPAIGTIWHDHSYPNTSVNFACVTWSGTQFVIVGQQGFILTSPDGITWTRQYANIPATSLSNLVWSAAKSEFIAIGNDDTILTSSNGSAWIPQHIGNPSDLSNPVSITWSAPESKFVMVGNKGLVRTSSNGITWATSHAHTLYQLWGVAWVGTQFVTVGDNGDIFTSPDGTTWTRQNSTTKQGLSSVAGSGSRLVVVGFTGLILTSLDGGHTWKHQQSNTGVNLVRVTWSGTQFVIVGDKGTILTSPDGITWLKQNSESAQSLFSITGSKSRLVATGYNGTILTSP